MIKWILIIKMILNFYLKILQSLYKINKEVYLKVIHTILILILLLCKHNK